MIEPNEVDPVKMREAYLALIAACAGARAETCRSFQEGDRYYWWSIPQRRWHNFTNELRASIDLMYPPGTNDLEVASEPFNPES